MHSSGLSLPPGILNLHVNKSCLAEVWIWGTMPVTELPVQNSAGSNLVTKWEN